MLSERHLSVRVSRPTSYIYNIKCVTNVTVMCPVYSLQRPKTWTFCNHAVIASCVYMHNVHNRNMQAIFRSFIYFVQPYLRMIFVLFFSLLNLNMKKE